MLLLIHLKLKEKRNPGKTDNNGKKNVEIMVSLKYLSNSWRTLEIHKINCWFNFNLKVAL